MGKRRQQEPTGAARRVGHCFSDLRIHDVNNRVNQRSWREVLPSAALLVLSVLLQDAFIKRPLEVPIQKEPLLLIDKLNDFFQVGRALNAVRRLGKNCADKPLFLAQNLEGFLVMPDKVLSLFLEQIAPSVLDGN